MIDLAQETIRINRRLPCSPPEAWKVYEQISHRINWCVPAGDGITYLEENFREGARDIYRCGPLGNLDFSVTTDYCRIVPNELISYAETVTKDDVALASSLVTWHFEPRPDATLLRVTSQTSSYAGAEMIEGNRTGYRLVVGQLAHYLSTAA
ncbi:SRPBCC domain-containing protein [Glutamicibacter sp. NPDC087344]|uniref:SRPBCC domain-containing protein n=1 Tax=Glutamicibacter sp. NPDC087344 TaxID=3363994 RepID=UPI00381C813E